MASWISFSFLQRSLNWLRLSWNGRKSQLQTAVSGTYQAIQCSLVMSWLCFLVALCMGPSVLFKVYSIALNPVKSEPEPWWLFTLKHIILERGTAHLEMISITWCFNQISQLWAHIQQKGAMKLLQERSMYRSSFYAVVIYYCIFTVVYISLRSKWYHVWCVSVGVHALIKFNSL